MDYESLFKRICNLVKGTTWSLYMEIICSDFVMLDEDSFLSFMISLTDLRSETVPEGRGTLELLRAQRSCKTGQQPFRVMTKEVNWLTTLGSPNSGFSYVSPLELELRHFGPLEIRILHGICFLEPAPKLWNPKCRSENEDLFFPTLQVGIVRF